MAYFTRITEINELTNVLNLEKGVHFGRRSIVLFDENLLKIKSFKIWIKNVPFKVSLKAGESLKSIESFIELTEKIHAIARKNNLGKDFTFVAIGGGSVTDAVGFLASIYQRGHPLVLIPSTWLCAVDSAFGGKNGINIGSDKNQLGTINQANRVVVVDELLLAQPKARTLDGFSETLKMGVINNAKLFARLEPSAESLLKNLSIVVECKMKVVNKDPFEINGIRYVLNFGHTFGHVFETRFQISHGLAVLIGQIFAAEISFQLGHCSEKAKQDVIEKLLSGLIVFGELRAFEKAISIDSKSIKSQLMRDKKFKDGKMNFVVLKKIGHC